MREEIKQGKKGKGRGNGNRTWGEEGKERERKLGRRCFDDALSTGLVFCIGCFIKGRDKIS